MTTVAWDGKTLAGDRMCSFGTTPLPCQKVHSALGVLFGSAGHRVDGLLFKEWMEAGRPADKKPAVQDNFTGIVIELDSSVTYYCDRALTPVPMGIGCKWALGSGCDYALGAMEAGASAVDAVEIASRLDIHSGLGVDSLELRP